MEINAKQLREIYVPKVKLIANDERFYAVPFASNYALTTYGRLFRRNDDGTWNGVHSNHKKLDYYTIEQENVTLPRLIRETFFPEMCHAIILPNSFNPLRRNRWTISDLYVLGTREELVELIRSKIEHRKPDLPPESTHNRFINRLEPNQPIRSYVRQVYWDMRSRSTNPNVKGIFPTYSGTTISAEWLHSPSSFYQHLLDIQYEHPEHLEIDKDILGLGVKNHYGEGLVALVPRYINNIFTKNTSKLGYSIQRKERIDGSCSYMIPGFISTIKGEIQPNQYFDSYEEALVAARKKKAAYIRKIVDRERSLGYMPEHILQAMLKWADGCEKGEIKIWEPSPAKEMENLNLNEKGKNRKDPARNHERRNQEHSSWFNHCQA